MRNKETCRAGRSQQEEDVSDQGPVAVPGQQVCVTGNHQQSAAEKHPAGPQTALLEAFLLLGRDITAHFHGLLLPSNQQHLPPLDLISTDPASPTPQPQHSQSEGTHVSRSLKVLTGIKAAIQCNCSSACFPRTQGLASAFKH